jgi:hypothetical protein
MMPLMEGRFKWIGGSGDRIIGKQKLLTAKDAKKSRKGRKEKRVAGTELRDRAKKGIRKEKGAYHRAHRGTQRGSGLR